MAAPNPPPSATVYARNLEERIKIPQLQEALTEIFSEYGKILEIVAKTNLKAKGQAFIVFEDVESAKKAIDDVQGFELFGKPMQLAFARTRSDATVAREGDSEEFEMHKRRRLAEKDKKKAAEAVAEQQRLKRTAGAAGVLPDTSARPAKAIRGAGLKSSNPSASAVVPDEYLPPNKILFVQNLPDEFDVAALTAIFGMFEGFKEVRMVPGRRGIAFIEYEAEAGAITAKENTAGMTVGSDALPMRVTYRRE